MAGRHKSDKIKVKNKRKKRFARGWGKRASKQLEAVHKHHLRPLKTPGGNGWIIAREVNWGRRVIVKNNDIQGQAKLILVKILFCQ